MRDLMVLLKSEQVWLRPGVGLDLSGEDKIRYPSQESIFRFSGCLARSLVTSNRPSCPTQDGRMYNTCHFYWFHFSVTPEIGQTDQKGVPLLLNFTEKVQLRKQKYVNWTKTLYLPVCSQWADLGTASFCRVY